MLVATFGSSTAWIGKTITYDAGVFTLEGQGPIGAQDVLAYDQQGHLVWAYEGLREWVQQLAATGAVAAPQINPTEATQPMTREGVVDKPKRPLYRRWWVIALGVLVLLIVIGTIGNAADPPKKTQPVAVHPVAKTPAQTPTPTTTPTVTPTPTPTARVAGIGDTIKMGSGKEQIRVTLASMLRPTRVGWLLTTSYGDGWDFVLLRLVFRNTGSKYYHSHVSNWSWLKVEKNPDNTVEAEGSENTLTNLDFQGGTSLEDQGVLQLDAGGKKVWWVAFKVRKVAKPVSFTYQGPGDKKVTWMLQ